jgi:osmotically-inducible protein OsmY
MNDKQLRKNVIEELDFEPSIDAANIGVAAEDGVVTLSGHVATYLEKLAAERAAWRVRGVRAIAQEIEVRLPTDKKRNDDEIASRCLDILSWSTSLLPGTVQVRVESGYVTLTGRVHWNYQRQSAESAARRLSGVKGVINRIELDAAASATDIQERILKALERQAGDDAGRIQVSDRDGRVKLSGDVDNWDERMAVERAAWAAPGVTYVEDNLRIV